MSEQQSDTPISDATPHNVAELAMRLRNIERQLAEANARITTLQVQLSQRCEMMRELEVECGTKDFAEAVKFIRGLKERVDWLIEGISIMKLEHDPFEQERIFKKFTQLKSKQSSAHYRPNNIISMD